MTERERHLIAVLVEFLAACPPDMDACFSRELGPARCVGCWTRWLDNRARDYFREDSE